MVFRSRLCGVLLVGILTGCAAAQAPKLGSSGTDLGEPTARSTTDVAPFREIPQWTDEDARLRVNLPKGWFGRPGTGASLLEARGPAGSGIDFVLRRWNGSAESLEGIAADRVGWLSQGSYGHVADIADDQPWVHSRPAGADGQDVEVGWHFRIDGRGFSLVATVPRVGFESSVSAVREVLAGLERSP